MTTEKKPTAPDMTERKDPLPAEEMLQELRMVKRLWPKVAPSVGLGDGAEEVAALEQAIALVETLESPEFNILTRTRVVGVSFGVFPPTPPERACAVGFQLTGSRLATSRYGATPMEAILKAHEILYPSTPAAPAETEDIPHGE